MSDHHPLRAHVHSLTESLNVLEYIVDLVEKKRYRFDDDDAPHYIAEMKKAAVSLRDTRDSILALNRS